MNVVEEIKKNLEGVFSDLGFQTPEINLTIPPEDKFGDFSTNIALRLAKDSKESPQQLAVKIKTGVEAKKLAYLDKVEIAGPGFINFYLSTEFLITQLSSLLNMQKKIVRTGQTAIIEFTDPNPFKEFHIGHLYSNIVGESLSRIREFEGWEVKRLCYQGDVGLHVAKAIYGMKIKLDQDKITLSDLEKKDLRARVEFMGQAYTLGDKAYGEEDSEAKSEIIDLNKKIYAKDSNIEDLYSKGRAWSLEYFDSIYARLGTKFDKFYFESDAGPKGLEIVKNHIKDGIFEESDGAVIFDGEKYGLHKRVFINSLGLPTYEAKELGLAFTKSEDFKFDLSIIVTAKEISDYFKVLFKALSLIDSDLASKMRHIGHGFVKLPEGKMSSRTGNIVTGEWLLNESVSKVKKAFPEMDEKTAEEVGVGAVKYSLLKSGMGNDIVFNFDESISLEGNSGPYLQYTNVRCLSVLQKSGKHSFEAKPIDGSVSSSDLPLLKKLAKFESEFIFTDDFSQSTLCTYLYELASIFNAFYSENPILKSENEEFRLFLVAAVSQVLTTGLDLLGIAAPSKM